MQKNIKFSNNMKIDNKFNGLMLCLDYNKDHKCYTLGIYPAEFSQKLGYGTYVIEPMNQLNLVFAIKIVSRYSKKQMNIYEEKLQNISTSELVLDYQNYIRNLDKKVFTDKYKEYFNG